MSLKSSYRLDQVLYDLIGKPVGVRRGPATVTASDPAVPLCESMGRRRREEDWSQETCLISVSV